MKDDLLCLQNSITNTNTWLLYLRHPLILVDLVVIVEQGDGVRGVVEPVVLVDASEQQVAAVRVRHPPLILKFSGGWIFPNDGLQQNNTF